VGIRSGIPQSIFTRNSWRAEKSTGVIARFSLCSSPLGTVASADVKLAWSQQRQTFPGQIRSDFFEQPNSLANGWLPRCHY
jgi:hypothetical protein